MKPPDKKINILEIGVQNGGSLEIWADFFNNAEKIIGCDIDPKCGELIFENERISIVIGDVNDYKTYNRIVQVSQQFDIIIDDGSHNSSDIIRSFSRYFPLLRTNGIYVIEDLHASYWQDSGDGLYNPFSAISFLKKMIDVLNYEHWRINKTKTTFLKQYIEKYNIESNEIELDKIHSIEFLNSIAIISKAPINRNILGKRIDSGSEEHVTKGYIIKNNKEDIFDIQINNNEDSNWDIFNFIEQNNNLLKVIDMNQQALQRFTSQLEDKEKEIGLLKQQCDLLTNEVINYSISNSWRITRPFRKIRGWFNKEKRMFLK